MKFETNIDALGLRVQIAPGYPFRSCFAPDVLGSGSLVGSICHLRDEDCTGDYPNRICQTGEFSGTVSLWKGKSGFESYSRIPSWRRSYKWN